LNNWNFPCTFQWSVSSRF